MARLAGVLFVVLAGIMMLGDAGAQDKKQPKVDVDGVFKKLDVNSDGKLQKAEFLKLADHFKDKEKAREKLTVAFTKIDERMVGYLSKEQFRTYIENGKKKDDNR
jgi:Ca2+-binding EF-hand superfamily protein